MLWNIKRIPYKFFLCRNYVNILSAGKKALYSAILNKTKIRQHFSANGLQIKLAKMIPVILCSGGGNMKRNMRQKYSSLQNAIRLLNVFSVEEPELGISALAEKLGISKSAVHRLVTSMASEGFIAKDINTNMYRLGISILGLGNVVTSTMKIYRVALPVLQDLGKLAKESVHLGIFRDDKVVFLNRIDSPRSISSLSVMGSQVPAHCTCSGLVFLAYQPKETVERIIAKGLTAYTEKTITDRKTFLQVLENVRRQGYAVCIEEYQKGVTSVAAPVFNARRQVIATVSTPGPTKRMNKETIEQLVKWVTQAAQEISRRYQQETE
jgi:DNA-binding IclR family transcriptional regulator